MKRFVPQFHSTDWRDGVPVLHTYLVPDLSVDGEPGQLTAACHQAMKAYPKLLRRIPLTPCSRSVAQAYHDHLMG